MTKPSRRGLMTGLLTTAAALALPLNVFAAPSPESPEFPAYVMDQIDDMHRGKSSHAVLSMTVQTKHWTRTMEMEAWSRGEEYSLIRILAPKKEKGTATLKAKDDLFTYLAKTGRTIKIAGAMMGSSWMGSHLNNNDLVKAARVADNYDLKVAGKGTIDGVPHYVLTATAKRDAAVVWGKIEVMIRTEDLLPTRQIFYDEDGTAIRIMEFEDYQMSGDRKLAKRMVISPLDGSGEFTRVEFKKMDFDVEVPESLFTIQHLKSI